MSAIFQWKHSNVLLGPVCVQICTVKEKLDRKRNTTPKKARGLFPVRKCIFTFPPLPSAQQSRDLRRRPKCWETSFLASRNIWVFFCLFKSQRQLSFFRVSQVHEAQQQKKHQQLNSSGLVERGKGSCLEKCFILYVCVLQKVLRVTISTTHNHTHKKESSHFSYSNIYVYVCGHTH